jgi:hypothetical protein
VSRQHRIAPVLPAVLVAILALVLPALGSGERGVAVSAGSVTAKAAQNIRQPAAARFPVDGPQFAEAQRLAAAHWGASACNGRVAVSWQPLERGTNATATWRNPTDAWNNPVENFDCAVTLNTEADFDFAKLCTVLTHEVGHLVGRQHAERDGDLMSPIYAEPLPACVQAAPQDAPDAGDDVVAEDEAAAADKPAAKPAATRKASSKRSLRKRTKGACVRRFSDGRKAKRCGRVARQATGAAKRR